MSEPLTTAEIQIQVNWNHYLELIEFVILAYDYLLTFDLEIERFWKRDTKRLAAILFFVNRYLTLLGNVPFVLLFFRPGLILRYGDVRMDDPFSSVHSLIDNRWRLWSFYTGVIDRREALDLYAQILIYVVQINISILFLLRMHAIYGGSKRIAGFLGVVLIADIKSSPIGVSASGYYSEFLRYAVSVSVATTIESDWTGIDVEDFVHLAYLWIGIFVFDLCVFSLTLWKTYCIYKDGYMMSRGIGTVVMRDGLMYFGIITLATLANILAFAFGTEFTKGLLPIFSNIISSVMMSRLMLNLREGHTNETQMSGLIFANNELSMAPQASGPYEHELSHRQSRTNSSGV
ncbi:hypothetical protein C8R41DRAFT_916493 [Lentinula lateritia]|uniref:DUF6533 domain-containing protein n=1 Tax=Lentinula lateritia TaxID=40482 RepID=A0ABQ8VQA4_9AGAR|nr:hypothetical protein C8R41DRAFT_916493 [Lentinula lateritia]